jgi:coenzyme PQQ precursor peptide PqqA
MRYGRSVVPRRRNRVGAARKGDISMTWQTPTATDLRFGFEITMYVAAR